MNCFSTVKEKIESKDFSALENVEKCLKIIDGENKYVNAFLHLNENVRKEAEEVDRKIKNNEAGKLAGLAIAVKSNVSTLDMPVNCGSKVLENYFGTYDADVVKRIKQEDGLILGMVNMDEFACGSSGETSAFGPTNNPACHGRIPGGSSSGSAAALAAGMCDISLGSDTGGSIRNPASHCGVIGVKPSYGRVSRFGLVDLSMSLDQIGPLSRDVYGSALMMEVISGRSKYDAVSFDADVPNFMEFKDEKIKIGMSSDFEKLCSDKRIYDKVAETAGSAAEALGSKIENVNLNYVHLSIQAYYPLVYVECFSGTRKFDGRKYGKKIEDSCGEEVLRRILGGKEISKAEYEGKHYRKALSVKKFIENDFVKAFKEVDVIISPVTPALPQKIGELMDDPLVMYACDAFTIPANLAGICAGVIKCGEIEGMPIGLQVMAPAFREDLVFQMLRTIENAQNA